MQINTIAYILIWFVSMLALKSTTASVYAN